ncbi:hypothetical protein Leryth_021803 [Lithospermum erythrorhizon]|nr:hypothetical protein Leryth_021803 [Lithospermum erythrorhizon]
MSYQAGRIFTPRETRKRKERHFDSSFEYDSNSSNQLLGGYMAHEFLTKGTLFGQKFDPARAEAVPVKLPQPRRNTKPRMKAKPDRETYIQVATLLKKDGVHIPNIFNPTQLACWIRMSCRENENYVHC